jgi:hypothetical protein
MNFNQVRTPKDDYIDISKIIAVILIVCLILTALNW